MGAFKTWVIAGALSLSTLCASGQQSGQQQPHQPIQQALSPSEQLEKYLLRSGAPSRAGIDYYVRNYLDSVRIDFEKTLDAKILYDLYFETDDLSKYYFGYDEPSDNEVVIVQLPQRNGDELGYYESQGYAVITNEEKFLGYSLQDTKKRMLWNVVSSNRFVRGVMIHEMAHAYIEQVTKEMAMDSIRVARPYGMRMMSTPGSLFIEEGVAEYCSATLGEVLFGEPYTPRTVEDLMSPRNYYDVNYKYSASYLKKFLDNIGLRKGLEILMSNDPPTLEEMLDSEKYFSRLKIPGSELKLLRSVYK